MLRCLNILACVTSDFWGENQPAMVVITGMLLDSLCSFGCTHLFFVS